jgi:hypothetical protein
VIFSRKRGNTGRHSAETTRTRNEGYGSEDIQESDHEESTGQSGPEYGPYDVTQAPKDEQERLDLGALRIPAVAGVEIHLQAGPQGQIQQIQLAHGASRLQLGAFAAPRTEGIWDEIRETLRTTLAAGGARPEEIDGDYGIELRAQVRDGSTTTDVRHVGIDGPRWFVHGVFLGAAAVDPRRAGPLLAVLRGLVVDRGTEARPVSEALPLRLPPDAAAQLAEAGSVDPSAESQAT